MATLTIIKKSLKTWVHQFSDMPENITSKFYFTIDGEYFRIVEIGQEKRNKYKYTDITIIDDVTSTTYDNFSSITELSLQLEALKYPAFQRDYILNTQLIELQDVEVTSVENGQVLVYEDGVWKNQNQSGGSGGSQDLQQVLENGATALDKAAFFTNSYNNRTLALESAAITLENTDTGDSSGITQVGLVASGNNESIFIDKTKITRIYVDYKTEIFFENPTSNRVITIPDENGTFATREWVDTQGFEQSSNKATTMTGNTTSNTKYLSAKAVYDWVMSLGFITNVVTALGFTPENVSNKSTSVTTDQASNTKYPSVKSVYDWAVGLFYSKTEVDNLLETKEIKHTELNLLNDYTLSSITTAQKLFNVGTSGNGAFSLDANSLYEFEMFVYLDNLSTTSSNFSFQILGTATYSNILLKTEAIKQAFITSGVFNGIITATTSYQLVVNSILSTGFIKITGSFRTSSAGTFIPSILLSVANAANVKKGSNAKIKKIGADTFTATSGIS